MQMTVKILEANGKPAFVVMPYDEYRALRELAEDADDVSALVRFAKRLSKRMEQTFPSEMVDRLLGGESALRVWREYRRLTAAQLAAAVKITPAHLSKLESGHGNPSLAVLRRLAKVLDVELDLLVGRDVA
jgi:DNA-binding XRE family transcriptional regulator